MSDTPYQLAPQIAQLQAERENAVAYGNDKRVEEIDRQLTEFGVKAKAAEERKVSSDTDKRKAPQGRSAKPTDKAD